MNIWEAIYDALTAASAITNLTSSIYHGTRPSTDDTTYAINYFQLPGLDVIEDTNGVVEDCEYQISCRATTPGNAQDLARAVATTLHNMKNTVINSSFDLHIVKKVSSGGLIIEQDGEWYHVPLTFRFVFQTNTTS